MTLARLVSVHARLLVTTSSALTLLALLAACGGSVAGSDLNRQPDPSAPTDPPEPTDPPRCAAVAPACDLNDVSFSSDEECNASGAAYCYSRSETCSQQVIWCGHVTGQCPTFPSCAPGDNRVSRCPSAAGTPGICYPSTTCGTTTILCFHAPGDCKALPTCESGDKQVPDGQACANPELCYTRTLCGTTITCSP